ncbi:putative MFS family arabinose efflux permease [Streptacidiphilus sp. MAP12-33]|uniref:MFS transporter n=1 Tax=Streptacidiphilus sp. MAP12-33 TaxID=3156266 RepID=UPI0035169324
MTIKEMRRAGGARGPARGAGSRAPGAQRRRIALLAVAGGLIAANLYYCQPLLPRIAASFGADRGSAGLLVTLTQLGYTAGLLLIVPLGDIVPRRRLVGVLTAVGTAGLVLTGVAPGLWGALVGGLLAGAASSTVQILTPYAASIAPEGERARAVGTMLTGVLLGILLSRSAAGLVGATLGWRGVFLLAALVLAATGLLLHRILEPGPPEVRLGYRTQLAQVFRLAASESLLRRRALIGACCFAAFSCFWATSAFLLAGAPYRFGESAIGWFALVGAAGALAARTVGGLADRGHQRAATAVLLGSGVAAFAAMVPGGRSLAWLVAGVLVMDVAVQGTHLMNMSDVYALPGHPRARLASVYMTAYYLGGTAGSLLGTTGYRLAGWPAVPCIGAALLAVALVAALRPDPRARTGMPAPETGT